MTSTLSSHLSFRWSLFPLTLLALCVGSSTRRYIAYGVVHPSSDIEFLFEFQPSPYEELATTFAILAALTLSISLGQYRSLQTFWPASYWLVASLAEGWWRSYVSVFLNRYGSFRMGLDQGGWIRLGAWGWWEAFHELNHWILSWSSSRSWYSSWSSSFIVLPLLIWLLLA